MVVRVLLIMMTTMMMMMMMMIMIGCESVHNDNADHDDYGCRDGECQHSFHCRATEPVKRVNVSTSNRTTSSFVPLQTNPTKESITGPMNLEEVEKRDNMLEHLLVILNSAAAIGIGPSPESFIRPEEEFYRTKSREGMYPGSGKGLKRG